MNLSDYLELTKDNELSINGFLGKPQYLTEILIEIGGYLPKINIVDALHIAIQIQRNQILSCACEVEEHSELTVLREIKKSIISVSESLPPY